MAATTLTPVARYIRDYIDGGRKPACEFVEGSLQPRPRGDLQHGWIQALLASLINQGFPAFRAFTELHVRMRPDEFLIPDVAVLTKPVQPRGYPGPTEPVYLCVEIRSGSQSIGELLNKCEEYHRWGVRFCWVVDPENQAVWQYTRGDLPLQLGIAESVTAGEIVLTVARIFTAI